MNFESVDDFFRFAESDEALSESLAQDNADVMALAAAAGFTFTRAQLLKYHAQRLLDMSESDLDSIVAGAELPIAPIGFSSIGGSYWIVR